MILLLSTSDTDLLSARASGAGLPAGATRPAPAVERPAGPARRRRPGRRPAPRRPPGLGGGLDALLAGRRCRWSCSAASSARRRADGALDRARRASPPRRTATWPRAARPTWPSCARFLSDTVLLTGHGFAPPAPRPTWGVLERGRRRAGRADGRRPLLPGAPPGRQHRLRRGALPRRSRTRAGRALPVFASSLRTAPAELLDDAAARPTRWSSPCSPPAAPGRPTAQAGGDDEAWDVGALAALDMPDPAGPVPDQQPRRAGTANDDGLSPLDAATQVAIPEFDGRIITVPFSFKEIDADGLHRLRRRPRAGRPGGRASPSATPGCGTSRRPSAGSC